MANTHKIKLKDGKIEYITESLYNQIWKDSTNGETKFKANGSVYEFEDIRRMESIDKRPMFDINQYVKNKTPASRVKVIENIARGLKGYINSERYKGTQAPVTMLDNMREVYKEAKLEVNK